MCAGFGAMTLGTLLPTRAFADGGATAGLLHVPHFPPRAPHIGAGAPQASARADALVPTIPRVDSSLSRLAPPHDGHAGTRSPVTNASNGFSQSLHWYSKRGMRLV